MPDPVRYGARVSARRGDYDISHLAAGHFVSRGGKMLAGPFTRQRLAHEWIDAQKGETPKKHLDRQNT